jgi:hypothetical protein
MDATETYAVYSATVATNNRLISAERVLLVNQAAALVNAIGATTINYASGGTDILTITHSGNLLSTVTVANAFDAAIAKAHKSGAVAPEAFARVEMPTGTGVFTLAIV